MLVLGTGGVSIFALQIAKTMGATVIATSSSDEKLQRVRAMGADLMVNYREHDDWGTRARDWTGGRGVDHVIEVGGPGTLAQSIAAVRVGGHISLIGVLTGLGGEVPTAALMAKQARLQGLIVGNRRHQVELVRAIDATGLRPVIDRSFALAEIADAFRHEELGSPFRQNLPRVLRCASSPAPRLSLKGEEYAGPNARPTRTSPSASRPSGTAR